MDYLNIDKIPSYFIYARSLSFASRDQNISILYEERHLVSEPTEKGTMEMR